MICDSFSLLARHQLCHHLNLGTSTHLLHPCDDTVFLEDPVSCFFFVGSKSLNLSSESVNSIILLPLCESFLDTLLFLKLLVLSGGPYKALKSLEFTFACSFLLLVANSLPLIDLYRRYCIPILIRCMLEPGILICLFCKETPLQPLDTLLLFICYKG